MPNLLQFTGSQRVGHALVTEQQRQNDGNRKITYEANIKQGNAAVGLFKQKWGFQS